MIFFIAYGFWWEQIFEGYDSCSCSGFKFVYQKIFIYMCLETRHNRTIKNLLGFFESVRLLYTFFYNSLFVIWMWVSSLYRLAQTYFRLASNTSKVLYQLEQRFYFASLYKLIWMGELENKVKQCSQTMYVSTE